MIMKAKKADKEYNKVFKPRPIEIPENFHPVIHGNRLTIEPCSPLCDCFFCKGKTLMPKKAIYIMPEETEICHCINMFVKLSVKGIFDLKAQRGLARKIHELLMDKLWG